MSDTMLMATIAAIVALLVWLVSAAFYATRLFDEQRKQQERLAMLNDELLVMRRMVRETEMRRRVLDSVPVSKLIGDERKGR